jgi:hypothetical protein
MNIYQPYEVLADRDDCLHLIETDARERIHLTVFRILPIFLLLFVWFILQQIGPQIPMGWNYLIIAATLSGTAFLFFKSYVTEIKITAGEIYLLQKTIKGPKEVTIPMSQVEGITLKRKKGKAAGAFFSLHTKTKKIYPLLTIPGFYAEEHHIVLISERLKQMLSTEILVK